MPADEMVEKFCTWLLPLWPRLLMRIGWLLFAAACLAGARVPTEALLAGPALMVVAVAYERGPWSRLRAG
jgi:hypothetical protein